ncbi:hypothetical protein B0H19DRAFT_1064347 [Mycena capillaripes]|nr:hypothetical protein B0H19DRAFT_1064347 [Mycena capillaripes]
MFSFALIAFAFLASNSALSVHSAPVGIATVPHACSEIAGTGSCYAILSGAAFQDGVCNNVSNIKSLVFTNKDDECVAFSCVLNLGAEREKWLIYLSGTPTVPPEKELLWNYS